MGCGLPLLAMDITMELPIVPTPRLFDMLACAFGGDCRFGLLLPNGPIPIAATLPIMFLFPCKYTHFLFFRPAQVFLFVGGERKRRWYSVVEGCVLDSFLLQDVFLGIAKIHLINLPVAWDAVPVAADGVSAWQYLHLVAPHQNPRHSSEAPHLAQDLGPVAYCPPTDHPNLCHWTQVHPAGDPPSCKCHYAISILSQRKSTRRGIDMLVAILRDKWRENNHEKNRDKPH